MRVSALKDDSGYEAYQNVLARNCTIEVMLNGKLAEGCYTADDGVGYVVVAKQPIHLEDGEVAKEVFFGDIEIIEVPCKELKGNK